MIALSRTKLVEVVNGEVKPSTTRLNFSGLEFDSRAIRGGELFVALKGAASHGHAFLGEAFKRGAALFLVEDPKLLDTFEEPERLVVVKDTLTAFSALASFWRAELGTPIIAVTGSVGKTTVKEMCAALLASQSRGAYSQKSFNNHVGVPYTLCRIAPEHKWAVIEVGMNHAGEIRVLTELIKPDVAVVSTIAPAHIEFFKDIAGIVDAKLEITTGLKPGATLIINHDSPELLAGIARHDLKGLRLKRFGHSEGLEARVSGEQSLGFDGIKFGLELEGQAVSIEMAVLGTHNAMNAACAALAVKSLFPELPVDAIRAGLNSYKAPLMRLNLLALADGRHVLDDSYNANPASMQAALEIAKDLLSSGIRTGLILGDMLELGSESSKYHLELADQAAAVNPAFVIYVGSHGGAVVGRLIEKGIQAFKAETPESAAHTALKMPFDLLLVKASRGIGLDRSVKTLVEKSQGNPA
ncbi:MAG: UDP-N-acetylmuramoyl-tripeptide--D-alanyl-D-alanine ligase [Oligoflexia bacterium]|nr:UDP-N-acetylmuramoyl-tripeptide--D-alanyl-D-alanine ligase [Oligoflexia bacterium]